MKKSGTPVRRIRSPRFRPPVHRPAMKLCLSAARMLDRGMSRKPNPAIVTWSEPPERNRHDIFPPFGKAAAESAVVFTPRFLRRRGAGDRHRRAGAGHL